MVSAFARRLNSEGNQMGTSKLNIFYKICLQGCLNFIVTANPNVGYRQVNVIVPFRIELKIWGFDKIHIA